VGGAQGMGRAIAESLARAGASLVLGDRDADRLRQTVDELRALGPVAEGPVADGPVVEGQVVDVRDDGALSGWFSFVDGVTDRIDVLVNVAGGGQYRPFLETDPDDWTRDIDWNYRYLLRSIQEGARRMVATGGGSVVNLTTIEAHRAAPGFAVYGGAKAAAASLTRSLAVELAPWHIRVNAVAPDETPTPGAMAGVPPSYFPRPERRSMAEVQPLMTSTAIPLGRPGTVQDIADAVLYLASDLSAYLTGQTLHVDGGAFASSGWFNLPALGFRNRFTPGMVEHLLDDAHP